MTKTTEVSRKFGIADGLILIAGIAAGLGCVWSLAPDLTPGQIWNELVHPPHGWSLRFALEASAELSLMAGIPFWAAWTPACLMIQVIPPRARWRRLRRQPGFVACLLASMAIVLAVGSVSPLWSSRGRGIVPGLIEGAALPGGILCGSSVLWSWAALWLGGACRPRPTWTGRLGRLTGAGWIVLGVVAAVYLILAGL
jgi:hypothetical protein